MADDADLITDEGAQMLIVSIEQAVLDGETSEIEKLTSDLFSGSPTDNIRRFEMLNQAMAGIGHTIYSGSATNQNVQAKREQQRRAYDAVLQKTLETIQQQKVKLQERLAELIIEHAILKGNVEELTQQLSDIKERIVELNERHAEIATRRIEIGRELEQETAKVSSRISGRYSEEDALMYKNDFEQIKVQYFTILHEAGAAPGEKRSHILWRDSETQGYYILDPHDENKRIDIPSDDLNLLGSLNRGSYGVIAEAGNLTHLDAFRRLNAAQERLTELAKDDPQLAYVQRSIARIEDEYQRLSGEEQNIRNELTQLKALEAELEEKLENAQKRLQENEAETAEIRQQLENLETKEQNIRAQLEQSAERLQIFSETSKAELERLLQEIEAKIEENKEKIEENEEQQEELDIQIKIADEGLESFKDRHDQLETLYGDWSTTWRMAAATVLSWIPGVEIELTKERALEFAEDNPEHQLTEAWKNVTEHNGKPVFRENETGKLYTLDQNGNPEWIQDNATINRIRHEIFKEGKLTANESPFYHSDNDSFDETRESITTAAALNEGLRTEKSQLAGETQAIGLENEELEEQRNAIAAEIVSSAAPEQQAGVNAMFNALPAARNDGHGVLSKEIFEAARGVETTTETKPTPTPEVTGDKVLTVGNGANGQ